MKTWFFCVVGVSARFADGNVSVLVAVSEDAADLAARKGQLATLVVAGSLFAKGLCPGAQGYLDGDVEERGLRQDGSPWLRVRPSKVVVMRRGNMALDETAVVWEA